MKRLGLLITALSLTATLLSGCDGNNKKAFLLFGTITNELVSLTYEQYSEKIEEKNDFIIFSTPNSVCTCWTSFRDSILMPYRQTNNLLIYTIPFLEFFDDDNLKRDSYGLDFISSAQTLGIFKDGRLIENRPYNSTHKIWDSKDSFSTFMEELIIMPTIIDINLTKLQNLYTQNSSFSVLYYDENAESNYLHENLLTNYARDNVGNMNNLYIVNTNVNGIKLTANAYDETQWQHFKDTFGLSEVNNADLGYNNGFVPSAQYIEPDGTNTNGDVIKAQTVYLNDTIEASDNPAIFEISSSYYSLVRESVLTYLSDFVGDKIIEGKEIPSEDVLINGENVIWENDKAALYHDPLFAAFLDYSLPQTTYVLE